MYSHGGILIETNLKKLYTSLNNKNLSLLSNFNEYKMQRGGYYNETHNVINSDDFIKTLNENQKYYTNAFENMRLQAGSPDLNMTFLLLIAVPFNSDNFIKNSFEENINVEYLSPIQVNFDRVRKGFFFLKDKNDNIIETVQVFGHLPNGFSNTIDYYEYKSLHDKAKERTPAPLPPVPPVPPVPPISIEPIKQINTNKRINELKKEIKRYEDLGVSTGIESAQLQKLKDELAVLQSQSKIQIGGDIKTWVGNMYRYEYDSYSFKTRKTIL